MNKKEINKIKNNLNNKTTNIVYSLIRSGFAKWKGGKPFGSSILIKSKGKKTAAEIVIEERI
ncbi:MAG: hypothetical protein FJW61_07315 [Actinobacteria bacterium]|nr:hypothetical protein [Actinomycetota bacterium]